MRAVCALSVALACLALPAMTLPDQDYERIDLDEDHTTIEASDKSRRSSAIPQETAGDLEISDVLRGFRVVSIGTQAFDGCSELTSVVIPEGVTNIADKAFYNCSALTNVVFPSTLKSIGAYAFVGCRNLQKVDIEVPRLTIGERAFRNCDGLQTLRFEGDELIAGTRAFFGCGGLRDVDLIVKDITLSEGVFSGGYDSDSYGYCDHLTNVLVAASNCVEIGASAFSGCTALRQVVVQAAAPSTFGGSVFSDCRTLLSVELPVGLVGVPTNAFASCAALQSVSLSSNVTSIAYRAFDTCSSLRSVKLSEGLRTIEAQAFYGCEALEELLVPQSVAQIGGRAFERCDGLGRLVFSEGDTNMPAAAAVSVGERAFYRNGSLTNVVLSQAVSSLGARTFAECGSLASVNLPTNLVEVSESLFEMCESLSAIDFPSALTAIGSSAFNACTNLTVFLIPTQNVVAVGTKAFYRTKYWNDWPNDSLVTNGVYILGFKGNPSSVVLPEGCKAIPSGMFEGMTALTNVTVPAALEKIGSFAFAGSGVVSVDLSGTLVSSLGVSAFQGCSSLRRCVLPENSLATIPDDAFHSCTSLTDFVIASSVTSICVSAFQDCSSLAVLTGGEEVRSVGDFAFSGCVMLQPFRFLRDVSYGEHVFQFVRWTENVLLPNVGTMAQEYPDTYSQIRSIVISAAQTNISDGACAGCVALEWVKIPNGVTRLGACSFEGCSALTSLVLSASVSSVGSNAVSGCSALASLTTSGALVLRAAFPGLADRLTSIRFAPGTESLCSNALKDCMSLRSVEIPSTVTSIGAHAFENCLGLTPGITIPWKVNEIGNGAFQNCVGLDIVRYMGEKPETVATNIYAGTKGTLVSGVRKIFASSWGGSSNETAKTLPKRWPSSDADGRRIAWWNGPSDGEAFAGQLSFYYYDATGNWQKMSPEDGLLEKPVREGYRFLGWFTKPYGGAKVTEFNYAILGVTEVYAHWASEDGPEKWADVVYETGRTHVYDGYLLDGNANVAGTIQIRLSRKKASAKLRVLGEGKPFSMKGEVRAVSETGGSGLLKKGSLEAEIGFSPNAVTGVVDGLTIVGARNVFGEKTDWDKRMARAALDDCGDRRSVVLRADGDSPLARGYAGLSVAFSKKGKCKVSGALPDGTKVKVTAQLLVFEDRYVLPVAVPLYAGKRGGIGFSIVCPKFGDEGVGIPYVEGLSSWVANPACGDGFVAQLTGIGVGEVGDVAMPSTFGMTNFWAISGVTVDQALLPVRVEITKSGKKWKLPKADKVTFDGNAGAYAVLSGHGNPAGLKLSYAAKTGAFKGSFKVYAVTESGEAKKLSAKVAGVVLDGRGYGSAVIKKAGAVPVVVEAR